MTSTSRRRRARRCRRVSPRGRPWRPGRCPFWSPSETPPAGAQTRSSSLWQAVTTGRRAVQGRALEDVPPSEENDLKDDTRFTSRQSSSSATLLTFLPRQNTRIVFHSHIPRAGHPLTTSTSSRLPQGRRKPQCLKGMGVRFNEENDEDDETVH